MQALFGIGYAVGAHGFVLRPTTPTTVPVRGGCSRPVAAAGVRAVRMLHRAPGDRPESRPTARGTRVARDAHRRMAFIGFVLALMIFCHLKRRLRAAHREAIDWADRHDHHQPPWEQWRTDWRRQWAEW